MTQFCPRLWTFYPFMYWRKRRMHYPEGTFVRPRVIRQSSRLHDPFEWCKTSTPDSARFASVANVSTLTPLPSSWGNRLLAHWICWVFRMHYIHRKYLPYSLKTYLRRKRTSSTAFGAVGIPVTVRVRTAHPLTMVIVCLTNSSFFNRGHRWQAEEGIRDWMEILLNEETDTEQSSFSKRYILQVTNKRTWRWWWWCRCHYRRGGETRIWCVD